MIQYLKDNEMNELPINENVTYDIPKLDTPINAVVNDKFDITSDNGFITFSKIKISPDDIIKVSFDTKNVVASRIRETFKVVQEAFPENMLIGVMDSVDIDIAKGWDIPLQPETDVHSDNNDLLCCNCGAKINSDDRPIYCSRCGQRIGWSGFRRSNKC